MFLSCCVYIYFSTKIHLPYSHKNVNGMLMLSITHPNTCEFRMQRWYDSGFVDTLRHAHPKEAGFYSWFDPLYPDYRKTNKVLNSHCGEYSNLFQGWRLDYTVCDTEFHASDYVDSGVRPDIGKFDNLSDHCPVCIILGIFVSITSLVYIYITLKPQPPVPPHPTPALSSVIAQKVCNCGLQYSNFSSFIETTWYSVFLQTQSG